MPIPSTIIDTPANTHSAAKPARLALLWFGVQLAWGAVLGISLQARSATFGGTAPLAFYGAVSTAGALAAAAVQLLVGPWSDRRRRAGHDRTSFYAAGAIAAAVALVALYGVRTPFGFAVAFVALQAGMNIAIGPYQAIVPDAMPPSRIGAASGWMAAMQSAGNAAGAIAATVFGNTLALGTFLALALLASARGTIAHVRRIGLQQPYAAAARFDRKLVDLFISRAFVYVGFYTLLGYLFFYIHAALPPRFPLSATAATGVAILLFTLVGSAGAGLAARPADRVDERVVVSAGGGVLALSVGLLAGAHGIAWIPVAILCAGVGWGVFLCADWAFACRLLPGKSLAAGMAIWNVAVVGPQILAPVITTATLARLSLLGGPEGSRVAFLLAAGEIALGTFWIWRLPQQASGN